VFLTDPKLRDMSRKFVEADVKRKFDMNRETFIEPFPRLSPFQTGDFLSILTGE